MLILLTGLLLICACYLPVRIQADVHHSVHTQGRINARFVLLHKTWHFIGLSGAATQLRQNRTRLLLNLFRRTDKARAFLLQHLRLEKLDVLALLRTQDAARSAILAGTVQDTLTCLPRLRRESIRIHVLPEFFRAHSTLAVRCIIRLRVGTIILTAIMLLIAYFREQRLTESEAV